MHRSPLVALGLLGVLILLGVFWQWLAMQDLLTAERLRHYLILPQDWLDTPWILPVIIAGYTVALLAMFPLTLLVGVTGLLFGPLWGFAYATAGTLSSSVASYWVGRRLGRKVLERYGGPRLHGLSRYFAGRGIRTMTVINLLPLAPFTLTNMMAGAFHLRFRDYMLGSALGIIPGLAAVTILGSQLGTLITASGPRDIWWALSGIAAGAGLLFLLHLYGRRRANRLAGRDTAPERTHKNHVSGAQKR